jgi:hypothetical protein
LALTLALSPMLSAWQGAVATAAPHAGHQSGLVSTDAHCRQPAIPQIADTAQDHCQGTQHDDCQGSCCVGCGHCLGTFDLVVVPATAHFRPILTPRVPRLLTSDFPSPRERPPRRLAV